jgi:hypothetical protein
MRPSRTMRLFAVLCGALAVVAALITAATLALALTPQDVGDTVGSEWLFALVPAACAVALATLGVALWRNAD